MPAAAGSNGSRLECEGDDGSQECDFAVESDGAAEAVELDMTGLMMECPL